VSRIVLVALLSFAVACGGARGRGPETPEEVAAMERLRAAAWAHPNDPDRWARLAELELLGEAGDLDRARATLGRAIELATTDAARARLALLSAWEHELQGRPDETLEAYFAAVDAARGAGRGVDARPWSPVVAEVALDGIRNAKGSVADYDARVRPVLERLLEEPGGLGHAAVDAAGIALANLEERRGDDEAEEALVRRLGCLRDWKAAGPFGPYPNLSFDERWPAEARGPLAGPYDLRPGATEQAPFEGEAKDCRVSFRNEDHAGPGSTIVETFVEIAEGGPKLLRIDTSASLKVTVDGELVHTVDRRRELHPGYVFIPVDLDPGRHELELKLTTSSSAPTVAVALDWPGRLAPGYEPSRGVDIPDPTTPAERLIAAHALEGRGNGVAAAWIVGLGDDGPLSSAAMAVHRANLLSGESFLPRDVREELQSVQYQRAVERAPDALVPALYEVSRRKDPNEVFEGYAELQKRFPDVVGFRYGLADMLQARGRPREAEAELRRVRRDYPKECRPVAALRELLASTDRVAEANALVADLMACDATSQARFDLLREQRRWADAEQELERLAPFLEARQLRTLRLELATARGDRETERAIRDEIMDEHPESSSTTRRRVDRLLAAGRQRAALAMLDAVAKQDPTNMEGLRNLRRDLTGEDDLEAYRIDGSAVLESYLEDGDPYPDAPQVLVLDYMATRIYPDGSARHLVHQITRVQSEESKERLGQFQPRGRLLTLHSIKPDGRRLEPERIAGVDTIPLTDLAIGDYVEAEFIWTTGPRRNGGFLSAGWSFASTVQPFHHSEMVVVVPDEVELTVETTGPVPPSTEERRAGERVLRWLMEGVPIIEAEHDWVAVPETPWPTLRFGWRAGWEPFFVVARDSLMDLAPSHPLGRVVCRDIVAGARSREESAGRIVDWVHEHIEPEDNSWGSSAPTMLYAESGNHVRVAHYLMQECDIPVQIAFARGIHRTPPGPLVDESAYSQAVLVVRAAGEGDPLVLAPGHRDAAWDWIPPEIRGQEAVLVADGSPRLTVPDPGPQSDLQRYEVEVVTNGGGAATVHVQEAHRGRAGSVLRRALRSIPEGDKARLLSENYVGRLLPGGTVTAIETGDPMVRDQPITLAFSADVPRFGRVAGGVVRVPHLFPQDLAARWAQRATRESTLGVDGQTMEVVTVYRGLDSPERTVQGLPPVALDGFGGGRYRREARVDGVAVVVERTLFLPEMNVPAADYPDFAAFCRAISTAETAEVMLY